MKSRVYLVKVWIFALSNLFTLGNQVTCPVSVWTKEDHKNVTDFNWSYTVSICYLIISISLYYGVEITGRGFLTRLWLLSDSGILIAFYYIYPLFLWRFLHRWLSPWNSFDWRCLSFPCPFSIRWHWNIFRNRSFLVFPIQFGCLYKLCSQHFSTLCRKDTVF